MLQDLRKNVLTRAGVKGSIAVRTGEASVGFRKFNDNYKDQLVDDKRWFKLAGLS